MKQRYCQCCGMPLGEATHLCGTESDGSKNLEYCLYCYQDGHYTYNGTMEEMIEFCVPKMLLHNPSMTEAEARHKMKQLLPTLKYWRE